MFDLIFLWLLPIFLMIYMGWSFLRQPKGGRKTYYGVLFLILLGAMLYNHVLRPML